MSESIVLMSDGRVAAIPVQDCGEDVVDVRAHGVHVDDRKRGSDGAWARVLQAAGPAEAVLETYSEELARAHPRWLAAELREAAGRFVSPPGIAPHSAGAAVDVALVDYRARELDMGTRVNAFPEESDGACYTAPHLSDRARTNRTTVPNELT
jgi:hypothetical protein